MRGKGRPGVVLTVLVLAVVAYFFGRAVADNWASVRETDLEVNVASAAAVLLFVLAVAVSGLLWGRMLSHLSGRRVGALEAVRVQFASWVLKYVPGQAGAVTNKVLWGSRRGFSRTSVVISFVYEYVFLLLGSIVPAAVVLVLVGASPEEASEARGALLPLLVALLPLLLLTNRRVFRWAVNRLGRRLLEEDVALERFLSGRAAVGYQLAFLVPRVLTGAAFVLVAVSFLDVPPMAYVPLGAVYVLAAAAGLLAVFVPSGIGVRESVIVVLASQYLPVGEAIVLSLVARVYATVGDGAVALLYGALRLHGPRRGRRPT